MPVERHITLVVSRQKKDGRIDSLGNLGIIDNFKYFDTVHIWYEKASGASNTTFTPLCETAFLFYKGDLPDVKRTAWFSEEQSNATNLWAVAPNEYETKPHTYYQKFSHEVALLLFSLSKPSGTRRFIYGPDGLDENLLAFVFQYKIGAYLYTDTPEEAKAIVDSYNQLAQRGGGKHNG